MSGALTVIGEHDPQTVAQLARCVEAAEGSLGVLCADGHVGYSQPVGGAVAYREHISVSGVGYDIGCGNKAVRTDLRLADVQAQLPRIMDAIVERISFGVGGDNPDPVDHPVLDAIARAEFTPQRALRSLAAAQLGTVGAGNHYVDLFADEQDHVWVGVHFGSRGFGHRTASGFLALARGGAFESRPPEGAMDAPPTLLHTSSELGQAYVAAMRLAGDYAFAGRDVVVERVLRILGARATEEVHNNHNFAWRERHGGEDYWVVRKGCTPAFPSQRGFVGSTMGEPSVILEGADEGLARAALFSTVHGAGRRLSRRQARVVDFDRVRADLRKRGIELRGGAADESPEAYKRLDEVLAEHGDSVRVLHRLRPVGVAMAGPGRREHGSRRGGAGGRRARRRR